MPINRAKDKGKGEGARYYYNRSEFWASPATRTRACVPPKGDRFALILSSLESI